MAFIRDIAALFLNKDILVEIDPLLLPQIKCQDKITNPRVISFNLYRLIMHIGTLQSRRFAPSNRMKFFDKADLLEKIYDNTRELRIRIADIRNTNGSEILTSISEDFGVGVSVVIAEYLFDTKRSTIQKIYGTAKRPDWKCQLTNNSILIVEAKGSTSIQTSNVQLGNALIQKASEPGDIKVASVTLLNEHSITSTRYIDPPAENNNSDPVMQNHILRAGHYASVFSFLGNSQLSRYYSQMRKRLEGIITSREQSLKNQTFRQLRLRTPPIFYREHEFVGTFYEIKDDVYVFIGVDKELLSFEGFLSYEEFIEDSEEVVGENVYLLNKDGILLIEISDINDFSNVVDVNRIKNFQENITISDIDEMNEISFRKYFEYILKKNGFFEVREEIPTNNNRSSDLSAFKDNTLYHFEFKLYKTKKIGDAVYGRLAERRVNPETARFVFVTNARIGNNPESTEWVIIDRAKLELIVKDKALLSEYLD